MSKILIIEDEEAIAELEKDYLELSGFTVEIENRGDTGLKRALLWRIAILTFFLSAILDNLTTSIVMIMILRKLVTDHKDRMVYASLVIIAANSGGAFSPIGDVTTIMLWNKGLPW